MKQYLIIFLAAIVFCQMPSAAQTGRHKRTIDVKVTELLNQLPNQKDEGYISLIEQIAATGEEGLLYTATLLSATEKGMNVKAEKALNGMTDYITSDENGKRHLEMLHRALVKAVARNNYAANKLFLLSLFNRCATQNDIFTYTEMMEDPDLTDAVAAELSSMEGIDNMLAQAISNGDAPHASLARIIQARRMTDCESLLISWTTAADNPTLSAIYGAMAVTGGKPSLDLLSEKARQTAYKPDPTHATDAYISMLDRMSDTDPETTSREAKFLMTSTWSDSRCAGLRLWIKTTHAGDSKAIIKTLKDSDKRYRETALDNAIRYGGRSILTEVSAVYGQLDDETKTEVMAWYGRNNAQECMGDIIKTIKKSSGRLYATALQSASVIGGEKALQTIISQISKDNTGEAVRALLSFKGDIADGMTGVFRSKNKEVVMKALSVAAERRVEGVYDNVKKLLSSDDERLRNAAYEALGGVATMDNVEDLCAMLNRSDASTAPRLQKALARALKGEDGESIYRLAQKAMLSSSTPELYYPLMALSGTDKAIDALLDIKTAKAEEALIYSDNPKVLPIMIDIARRSDNDADRDKILSRYLNVADGAEMTPEEKYLLLCEGMETRPSDKRLANEYIRAIGRTATVQALGYMRKYYDNPAFLDAVAEGVKNIVAQNSIYNGGRNVRAMLEIARKAYKRQEIDDAKATLAVEEINRMISGTRAEGFALSTEQTKMGKRGFWTIKENFENFVLSFDWKTDVPMVVTLRSMPILTIDNEKGVRLSGSNEWKPYKSMSPWNTAYIRMVDDSLTVRINGHALITDLKLGPITDGKPTRYAGNIGFEGGNDSLTVRYTRIYKMPIKHTDETSVGTKKNSAITSGIRPYRKAEGYIAHRHGRKEDM